MKDLRDLQELSCTFTLTDDLDPTFPDAAANGAFRPSKFQQALLEHVAKV